MALSLARHLNCRDTLPTILSGMIGVGGGVIALAFMTLFIPLPESLFKSMASDSLLVMCHARRSSTIVYSPASSCSGLRLAYRWAPPQ